MTTINQRIKKARLNSDFTIAKMAKALDVARKTVVSLETDGRDIKVSTLKKISQLTGESFHYLSTGQSFSQVERKHLKLQADALLMQVQRLSEQL